MKDYLAIILRRPGALVRYLSAKMQQHHPREMKKHHLGANIFQHSSPNPPKTGRHRAQGQRLRSNLNGFGVAFGFHLRSFFFNLSLNSSWQPCLKFGTVAALRAQRTGYPPPPRSGGTGVCESRVKVYQLLFVKSFLNGPRGSTTRAQMPAAATHPTVPRSFFRLKLAILAHLRPS